MLMSWRDRVTFVRQRAGGRCEYCLTDERLSGVKHEIDHIEPKSAGGNNNLDNLCLSCSNCNSLKWTRTHGIDPMSNNKARLFNPRQQVWKTHFQWSLNKLEIIGRTPCGRATIATLDMNNDLIVGARQIWIMVNRHPPV